MGVCMDYCGGMKGDWKFSAWGSLKIRHGSTMKKMILVEDF